MGTYQPDSLSRYEESVFVPLWKLRDVDEYHERASAHDRMERIARPLLVVHARDDPVVPGESLGHRH